MKLQDIKTQLGYQSLDLVQAQDAEGNKTQWYRHWDNEKRVAVSIHEDTIKAIQSNSELSSLGLQSEIRQGEKGAYTAYRIVNFSTTPDIVL